MSIELHNLKPKKGSTKKRKRVGRGNASGHGTYSTRGMKGQRSRSGGKAGLKIRGFKQNLLQIPKLRGFKSNKPKAVAINLDIIEKTFDYTSEVNSVTLSQKGLINSPFEKFKILSKGEITKKLNFKDCQISEAAKIKIEKAGGKVYNDKKSQSPNPKTQKKTKRKRVLK